MKHHDEFNALSFDDKLKKHDWLYFYSDDYRYWSIGNWQRKVINTEMRGNPELEAKYKAMSELRLPCRG